MAFFFLTICKPDTSPAINCAEFECHFTKEKSSGRDLDDVCAAESLETVVEAQVGHFRGNGMLRWLLNGLFVY